MPDPREYIIDAAEDPNAGEEQNGRPGQSTGQQADPEQVIRQNMSDMEFGARFSETLEEVGNNAVRAIADETSSQDDKSKILLGVLANLLPASLREVGSATPNADRSLVVSRTTILVKTIADTLSSIEKTKQDATVNPHAPRFQEAIAMFLEDVTIAFGECAPSVMQRDQFFNSLADRLRGWEERVEALNGASAAARAKKINPNTMALIKPSEPDRQEEVPPHRMN
jgi:hypothetical protein